MNLPPKIDHACIVTKDLVDTVNSLIYFLEEKFPQSDEAKCCEKCHGYEEYCSYCPCHTLSTPKSDIVTPHWESDYAAIWEKHYNDDYDMYCVRQDILELIRKIVDNK